ncbi:MAG: PQQ-binding-like beta-propeller repeat protein [Polyangiaceae bacterium]
MVVVGGSVALRLVHPRAKIPEWKPPPTSPTVDAGPSTLAAGALPAIANAPKNAARTLHGDLHRTHRATGRGPKTARIEWTLEIGAQVEAQVTTSPDGSILYASTLGGEVVAITRDGKIKWRTNLGGRVYGAPCVADDGTIYVGSDAKKFFAIAPASGAILWSLETNADADTAAAIAEDGTIVFASGKNVFDVRKTGDIAWRFSAKSKIFTAPAIGDDGTIYVGSQDDHAYAISAQGLQKWAVSLASDVDGAPAISDSNAIFFGDDNGEVVRIENDGGVAWKTGVGGFVRGPLSISRDGSLVVGTFGPAPREARIDDKTGKILGTLHIQGTGAPEFGIVGGALEDDDGTVYFGAQDDAAYAIARDGSVKWRLATGGDVDAPLTLLVDGGLIIPSDDGKVRLLRD